MSLPRLTDCHGHTQRAGANQQETIFIISGHPLGCLRQSMFLFLDSKTNTTGKKDYLQLPPFCTLCTWLLLMLQKENLDTAFELLHEMAGRGLQADNTTYTALFNLCAEARQGHPAEQLMQVQLSPPCLV